MTKEGRSVVTHASLTPETEVTEEVRESPLFVVRRKIPFKDDLMYILEIVYETRDLRIFWTKSYVKRRWACGICRQVIPPKGEVYRPLNNRGQLESARLCVPCMQKL